MTRGQRKKIKKRVENPNTVKRISEKVKTFVKFSEEGGVCLRQGHTNISLLLDQSI